jgi:hypothetical protein
MGRFRSYAPRFSRRNQLYSSSKLAVNQALELKTFDTFFGPAVLPTPLPGDILSFGQLGKVQWLATRVRTQGAAAAIVTLPGGARVCPNAVPQGVQSYARDGRKINMTRLDVAFRVTQEFSATDPANFNRLQFMGMFHFVVVLDTQFNQADEDDFTASRVFVSSIKLTGESPEFSYNDNVFRNPAYLSRYRVLHHGKHDWRLRLPTILADNANNVPVCNAWDDQVSIPLKGLPVTFAKNEVLTVTPGANPGDPPVIDSTLTPGGSATDNGIYILAWQAGRCGFSAFNLTYSTRLFFTG